MHTFRIEPDNVYHDSALVLALGITAGTLARARRAGELRFSRKGRRVLYRGQWLIDWLERDGSRQPTEARR